MGLSRRLLIVFALLWSIGIGFRFAFGPVYSHARETLQLSSAAAAPQRARANAASATGVAMNGPGVLLVLAVPVLLAVAPLLTSRQRTRSVTGMVAALTLAWCLVGAFSVGMFYLPGAAALGLAAALPRPRW